MSLEQSMEKLAEAMTYYADTIKKFGLKVETDNGETKPKAKTEEAEPKKKVGRPAGSAKSKADAEDDGFGGEDNEDEVTLDVVKAKLMSVKEAAGDKAPALKIIGKYGYNALGELQGDDEVKNYAKIVADCEKWLKANA